MKLTILSILLLSLASCSTDKFSSMDKCEQVRQYDEHFDCVKSANGNFYMVESF